MTPEQIFLIEAAMMLHRYGTPSHRLERVLTKVAESLGIHGEFLYTPTALVISLRAPKGEELTVVRRVNSGAVDVDKLIQFDQLLGRVESGQLSPQSALGELKTIHEAASLYSKPIYAIACAVACMCVAVFFGGTTPEVIVAGAIGLVVAGLELLHEHWHWEFGLLEPLAGVAAALASILIARYVIPIDDRLTTLAGLIVLIPGLRLTVALTELAVGHLSAGMARLAGAMVCLATLFVGVAIVWRITGDFRPALDVAAQSPSLLRWIALAIAPIAFAIVFRAGFRQWPIIAAVSISGVVVSWSLEPKMGVEVASFFGALAVGCSSNLYARIRDLPAMVPQTPGMLILVPGSLGYRSLSALLEQQTMQGVQYGFAMILIAISLVGGLLVSNAVVPPRRIL
ncbi:MAG: threonine/serine exporter family protein [Pirellulaceae bacterium]